MNRFSQIVPRLVAVLKQEHGARQPFGLPKPTPPVHFVLRWQADLSQAVTGNERVHVHTGAVDAKHGGGNPAGETQRPREDFLCQGDERLHGLAMTEVQGHMRGWLRIKGS